MCVCEHDLALNNPQELIWHKTQANQTKQLPNKEMILKRHYKQLNFHNISLYQKWGSG